MKRLTGILLGLTASALWGSFYIIGRWLFGEEGDQLNPYLFTLLRFILAVLFFSIQTEALFSLISVSYSIEILELSSLN